MNRPFEAFAGFFILLMILTAKAPTVLADAMALVVRGVEWVIS